MVTLKKIKKYSQNLLIRAHDNPVLGYFSLFKCIPYTYKFNVLGFFNPESLFKYPENYGLTRFECIRFRKTCEKKHH